MPDQQHQGLFINSKTISAIVGIIAIFGAMFAVFDKVSKYEYRIERIEYTEMNRDKEMSTLSQELKILNGKLTELTIEIRTLRSESEIYKNKFQ